jgi:hypothetical protein
MGDTSMEHRPSAAEHDAHAAWLARGRNGDGRLVLVNVVVTASLRAADLRYADFDNCTFDGVSLESAVLDGARFRRCSFEGADLRHATALDARFEDCDLRKASVAGFVVGPTGFLRCQFGDFASQPIGKPDVRAAYLVLAPDLSSKADGSRIGSAADIDGRWYTPSRGGRRRFVLRAADGGRLSVVVLDMHVRFTMESGERFAERAVHQTFAQLLEAGIPEPWNTALGDVENRQLRGLVESLSPSWTPAPTTETP